MLNQQVAVPPNIDPPPSSPSASNLGPGRDKGQVQYTVTVYTGRGFTKNLEHLLKIRVFKDSSFGGCRKLTVDGLHDRGR